jgi:nitrite reductase/ring-hydroxylating ferredoxin subunit
VALIYVLPETIPSEYRKLGRGVVISYGCYEVPVNCTVDDLDWNHMDQNHRPWIHGTYEKVCRVASGPDFQLSIAQFKLFGLPLLIQVTDLRLERGLFYQCYSLFNAIQIHAVIRSLPGKMSGERFIVSHWAFKFLHSFINRKLQRLNEIQNEEDRPMRERRAELRSLGYTFKPDERNFVTANVDSHQVRFPKVGDQKVSLSTLVSGELNSVRVGSVDFLIRPESGNSFSIWMATCPHEGGPLASGRFCEKENEIQCPWHGLKFKPMRLNPESNTAAFAGYNLSLNEGVIHISDKRGF